MKKQRLDMTLTYECRNCKEKFTEPLSLKVTSFEDMFNKVTNSPAGATDIIAHKCDSLEPTIGIGTLICIQPAK